MEVPIVKDAVGSLLREAWTAKGNPDCAHPELSVERSFSGVVTGVHICSTCGARIEKSRVETSKLKA
jgi:hypothetical protein